MLGQAYSLTLRTVKSLSMVCSLAPVRVSTGNRSGEAERHQVIKTAREITLGAVEQDVLRSL